VNTQTRQDQSRRKSKSLFDVAHVTAVREDWPEGSVYVLCLAGEAASSDSIRQALATIPKGEVIELLRA
jgi:hypothetical protein